MPEQLKNPNCPCCGRLLPIAGLRSGKVGCRQCRHIFFWDRSTGLLTPLAPVRPLRFLVVAIVGGLVCIAISALFFFWRPTTGIPPTDAAAVIDEASRHLKWLTE